ncbi:MAG TPA: helix-turn-helix transcriptional regulator [Candidatus Blautia excrementipullorum]|nr:helix-turn-helix transcriptional regulator [Candidatus Blautia excrementipullorum]
MNSYLIGKLKEGRLNKGLKQSDVTRLIGIKNTTLSNYENGNTEPDMDTFLKLCRLYDLNYSELLGDAYGYKVPGCSFDIRSSDIKMISKYHRLDDHGKEMVNIVLEKEYERSVALADQKADNIIKMDSHIQPKAAHARTDIEVTEEMNQHDDDIMSDDSEWE